MSVCCVMCHVSMVSQVSSLLLFELQNTHLHALTGWIPERVDLKERDEGALTALYRQLEHTLKQGVLGGD